MLKRFVLLCAMVIAAMPAYAQVERFGGGPLTAIPSDHNDAEITAQHEAALATARRLGLDRVRPEVAATGNLGFPLRLRPNSKSFLPNGISNFVDLNPTTQLKDFACGTRTYDGHRGNDLSLFPFAWRMMDGQEVEIIAAAPGTIINKADGSFDRSCAMAGNPPANFVIVRQDDGLDALYWHMKKGSVTSKAIGSRVQTGEVLGLVGSSGFSTGPHLHFELRTQAGATVDPWQGACGTSRTTHWRHQPETVHSDIVKIATHLNAVPGVTDNCVNPNPNYRSLFKRGDTVAGAVYLRDQRSPVTISFIRPDGTVYSTWTTASANYNFSYWYITMTVPAAGAGTWKVRAKLGTKTMEQAFIVGAAPAATNLALARIPASATIASGNTGDFAVTVKNTGATQAEGCLVTVDAAIAATVTALQTQPAVPANNINRVFSLAPGAIKKFRLSITPKAGYRAAAIKIPIRATCLNANSPATADANQITINF
jgi:murein DD-endopeptidase MepM/ murein hydrolase activator NlpD